MIERDASNPYQGLWIGAANSIRKLGYEPPPNAKLSELLRLYDVLKKLKGKEPDPTVTLRRIRDGRLIK